MFDATRLISENSKMEETLTNLQLPQKTFRGNPSHLHRLLSALQNGTPDIWNDWRKKHPTLRPDLRGVYLQGAFMKDLDLTRARLDDARIINARWWEARLTNADLQRTNLSSSDLMYADLRGAQLDSSRIIAANLTLVNAVGASFRGANLSHTVLNGAQLQGADLTGAKVTGTSAWGIKIDAATHQRDLIVERWVDPLEDIVDDTGAVIDVVVRINHLEAAHLLYLVTNNKTNTIIDALTDRVVLVLGNFGLRRKAILNQIRFKLAGLGYAPVVFDFDIVDRDLMDGVTVIAGLSRFVIADLTQPRSTPLESSLIASQFMIPFAPIIREGEQPFSMFSSLQAKYPWVLPTWSYRNQNHLIRHLKSAVINPSEQMLSDLAGRRKVATGASSKRGSKKRRP
jgi:uncharacterized protein YjbI with pentapeptide repeats